MKHSIVIVDSHFLFCEGLKSLFLNTDDFYIENIFSSGISCLNDLLNNNPDLLIIDSNNLDLNISDFIKTINKRNHNCKIVILTDTVNSKEILEIYDLRIDGYILKSNSFETLIDILKKVINSETYFEHSVLPIINQKLLERDSHINFINELTKREKQILICVANGMSNKEIGANCNISERTVKNHLSSIFQKIRVADRTQAAVFAIKNNLITL